MFLITSFKSFFYGKHVYFVRHITSIGIRWWVVEYFNRTGLEA